MYNYAENTFVQSVPLFSNDSRHDSELLKKQLQNSEIPCHISFQVLHISFLKSAARLINRKLHKEGM